jgi:tetratricopeptide (TPR) repeat protein
METNTISCFVIIGYGKKPSDANGVLRMLDLEETYSLLIKPVFDALNISCYRAIDKNLSGNIDKIMLQEIKNADIALVDLSTLNANVMWELGVRHALKPRHTIMICEKEQMNSIPFDINHFVVHQYTHTTEGIPHREVERFQKNLTKIVTGILSQQPPQNDSPVFTFLDDELSYENGAIREVLILQEKKISLITDPLSNESYANLIEKAENEKRQNNFKAAIELFERAKKFTIGNMTLKENLPFIITRLALCTYKSKDPNEQDALRNALLLLNQLEPRNSNDLEVLGLSGAIFKRLFELDGKMENLDQAIFYYEKGFQLKKDYYNGINAAFMLYQKAGLIKDTDENWRDIKLKADYIRNVVLEVSLGQEKDERFLEKPDAIWILLTIAEAYNYKGKLDKLAEYETKAKQLAELKKDSFAISSYCEQKLKIERINLHQTNEKNS